MKNRNPRNESQHLQQNHLTCEPKSIQGKRTDSQQMVLEKLDLWYKSMKQDSHRVQKTNPNGSRI